MGSALRNPFLFNGPADGADGAENTRQWTTDDGQQPADSSGR